MRPLIAKASRFAHNQYRCRWGDYERTVSYSFLLALVAGGYVVVVDQRRWRSEGERQRYRLIPQSS